MSYCPHKGFPITGLPPYGDERCGDCGHRVAQWRFIGNVLGLYPPERSSSRPIRTWPLELYGRVMARALGGRMRDHVAADLRNRNRNAYRNPRV